MDSKELIGLITAIIILFIVSSFEFLLDKNYIILWQIAIFSIILITIHVFSKKVAALFFDASVVHRIWSVSEIDKKRRISLNREIPIGFIIPIVLSLISFGFLKISAILSYEARALKHTSKEKYGLFTFSQMTDFQNGLIGVAGICVVLLLSVLSYFFNFELLFQMSAYYSLVNLLPVSDLDGNQIFYGSKLLWSVLVFISLIAAFYAFIL